MMNPSENEVINKNTTPEYRNGKKPKDYRKLSRIKSVIFLVLAVLVLIGMYVKEKPGQTAETKPVEAELHGSKQELSLAAGTEASETETELASVTEDGTYTDKDRVALYIHTYGKLPSNYITKTKAKKAGWVQEKGNLQEVLPGMSIGGGPFQNEEKLLPEKEGREYHECDIDYQGGERGGKRIVYSNDGLIYYTDDHYKSFTLLYGEEK